MLAPSMSGALCAPASYPGTSCRGPLPATVVPKDAGASPRSAGASRLIAWSSTSPAVVTPVGSATDAAFGPMRSRRNDAPDRTSAGMVHDRLTLLPEQVAVPERSPEPKVPLRFQSIQPATLPGPVQDTVGNV